MKDTPESLDSSYHGGTGDIMSDSFHSASSLTAGGSSSDSSVGKQRECALCVTVQSSSCFPKLASCHHR